MTNYVNIVLIGCLLFGSQYLHDGCYKKIESIATLRPSRTMVLAPYSHQLSNIFILFESGMRNLLN